MLRLLGPAVLAALSFCLGPVQAKPERIVSVDFCADQYVLKLAEPERIAALSHEARAAYSYMRAQAAGHRQVAPRAEDVLALRPDLIVRSYGGGPGAERFFERAGAPVLQLAFSASVADMAQELRRVGAVLGEPARAEAAAREVDARLAAVEAGEGEVSALYMTPGGVTAGPGALVHDLMQVAGLMNFQTEAGWRPLPLERLASEAPDIVLAAFFASHAEARYYWSAARHPLARKTLRTRPSVALPGAWMACGGWFLIDAVEAMARAARAAPAASAAAHVP